jgi:RimJ/RimL family protein N-acetyltransferase
VSGGVDVARAEKKDRSMPPGVWHGPHWGRGYAEEPAHTAIEDGFFWLGFAEIVAFTVPENRRSWQLIERLGMTRDSKEVFDHPRFAEGHPLWRHVLYRLRWPAL